MRLSLLLCTGLLFLSNPANASSSALDRLGIWMTGTFTTTAQARGDQHFRDISLHVLRIWPDRTDGIWLYSEQALTDGLDHPYRQYIYQLTVHGDDSIELRVHELPDPIAMTGAWKNPARLGLLSPTNLIPQSGGVLLLHAQPDGTFKGGTEGKGCRNTLQGASYAKLDLTIGESQMITWDRGYNANDIQVWGSTQGGYIFRKSE